MPCKFCLREMGWSLPVVVHYREGDLCWLHELRVRYRRLDQARQRWAKERALGVPVVDKKYRLFLLMPHDGPDNAKWDRTRWNVFERSYGTRKEAEAAARDLYISGKYESVTVITYTPREGVRAYGRVGLRGPAFYTDLDIPEEAQDDVCSEIARIFQGEAQGVLKW